jgi:hypothetical protein
MWGNILTHIGVHHTIPHPYWLYTKWLSIFICCGWAYGCTLTLLSCAGGGQILENWGTIEPEGCRGVMVEAANPH